MVSTEGSVVLGIQLECGRIVRRHKDHMRPRVGEFAEPGSDSSPGLSRIDIKADAPVDAEDTTSDLPTSSDTNDPVESTTAA